jgi:TRAP-type transport system periplasmic protein
MLTGHIIAAETVVVNDAVWRKLPGLQRDAISRAAAEASAYATKLTLDKEASDLAELKGKGMRVIGAAEGLDIEAFRARTRKLVLERFGSKWDSYYKLIESLR